MINLKDIGGTIVFSPNGNYIVGATDQQNAEFQQRCEEMRSKFDTDMIWEKVRNGDTVEIKGLTPITLTSENYNNIMKVTKMPGSVFGDAYGYQMQKDIADCMRQYYAGKISDDDVKKFFGECCSSMRIYHAQMRHTTGVNEEDNTQIVSQIYEVFAKENQRAARNANDEEGMEINKQYGADSRQDDWCYYNADYYYRCENTHDLLREAATDMAKEWELPSIDTDEIEKNSKFTLDGGFDFNSGWNFIYRNQVGRSSMEDEGAVPPKDFRFFYKESGGAGGRGILQFWAGGNAGKADVPFYTSGDSLKGQIFNMSDIVKVSEKDTADFRSYNEFIKKFSIFTRWYSYESGINNRFGNYMPAYE